MHDVAQARAWRIGASHLLGWNVLGGAVGGAIVMVAALLSMPGGASRGSAALLLLIVAVAIMLGAVGGLLGGSALVLARGARPTTRTLVRGIAAGLAVCALVVVAAVLVPMLPDGVRPLAVVVGLSIGAVMLGLAFRAHEVHWRERPADELRDAPRDEPAYVGDPIRDLVDPPRTAH